MRNKLVSGVISLIAAFWLSLTALAQDTSVPDLTGLSAPQAAAQLNAVGLALGTQSGDIWTAALGIPANTIGTQSPAAGSVLATGSAVDVTVFSEPNAFFIYDENDVTFVNQTGTTVNMREITFQSGDGARMLAATEWGIAFAQPSDCFQLWSIPVREAKFWEDCNQPTYWRSTRNTDVHFWTQVAGVTDFVLLQNGIERVRCDAAPAGSDPLRCDFFIATAQTTDLAPFLYMAYTVESFVVLNNTDDQWMRTDQTPFYIDPNDDEATFTVGDISRYVNPDPVANLRQLAPGQCIQLTAGNTSAASPEDCTVIARADLDVSAAFWQRGFQLDNELVGERVTCPPATPGRTTLCIMPR